MDKMDEQTIAQGGTMRSFHVFKTLRGDKISNVKGGHPKEGRLLEGPYPNPREVGDEGKPSLGVSTNLSIDCHRVQEDGQGSPCFWVWLLELQPP